LNLQRTLAKVNYHIHTDAEKQKYNTCFINSNSKVKCVCLNDAGVLNMALFGKTAKQWRFENTQLNGIFLILLQQMKVLQEIKNRRVF
jgi:hypothetical protein